MKKIFLLISAILFISRISCAQSPARPPFLTHDAEVWADSVLKNLNRDERVAQLIMIAAWSNKDSVHIKEIRKLIQDWGIGGLIFFQGGPVREALLTNDYQQISKVPLLIGMDAEWGLAMRLDSTMRFPRQMTMAAIQDDTVIYQMGNVIAQNCKRLGIHVNFAPDADINNNFSNPIIGSRSFGDDRESVTKKSISYMNALQDNHILATGKHFPGHGNADSDSHFTLPVIKQDSLEMDSVEIYPFRKLINSGLGSMMVAHLNVPSLEPQPNTPSTLSSTIVTNLLKEKLGFKGLIFTDALNMKAVSSSYKPGVVDKMALVAGNDVLLYSEDVRKAIQEIHLAVENCEITQEEIDARTKKILMVKYWCGLNKYTPVDTTNIYNDLNSGEMKLLQRKLYEKSVTLLKNTDSLLPFRSKDSLKIACLSIGDVINNSFQQQLASYGHIDFYSEEKDAPLSMFDAMFEFLKNYDYVILSIHGTSMKAQSGFGIPDVAAYFADEIMKKYKTVLVDFGNAYTLSRFKNLKKAEAVILAYEDFSLTHSITAQMIMGGISFNGKLPVSSTEDFKKYSGLNSMTPMRLRYSIPEEEGMSSSVLMKIDSIVANAIDSGATPGCQVLVARNGSVVYQKSFGTKTYDVKDTVVNTDLYDIASITKIAATALAAMKLYDQKKIDVNLPLSKYYSKLRSTNKKNLLIRDIVTHQAGLVSWIPFYKTTIDSGHASFYYSDTLNDSHSIKVADGMYLLNSYGDTILQRIFSSDLTEQGKYIYSDLGPILMKEAIEDITGKSFQKYVNDNFYKPLKLSRLTFNPLEKFSANEIVPTENDTVFRHQLIRGYVHDPASAMMGGVSGNAGIFSDANDLAIIMQMLLNKGSYGGVNYLKASTVEKFTSKQSDVNRRGLFFDKPETNSSKASPCAKEASPLTFGHQGFTGTCAWADPQYGLIYIFLSNRVNPDALNEKLGKLNVRTSIQEVIYKSMMNERFN